MDELLAYLTPAHQWSLECNPHRSNYETIASWCEFNEVGADDDDAAACIAADQLWWLVVYPLTPIGSLHFMAPSLAALTAIVVADEELARILKRAVASSAT